MTLLSCESCGQTYRIRMYQPDCPYDCPSCRQRLKLIEADEARSAEILIDLDPEIDETSGTSPKRLGRFVLVRDLGRGATGTVHQAWDTRLARWVALKVLRPGAADAEGLERFRQEAAVVASLDHPNIAPVFDVMEIDGRFAIVMKFIEGRTLHEMFLRDAPGLAPVDQVVRSIRDAGIGLGYAHGRGFVHRDLKPGNIMMDKEGRVYVLDFGFAKVLARSGALTNLGRIMGTPGYMSPEQARGQARDVDARSDVFSLGATLWTLLAGHRPFKGKTDLEVARAIVQDPTPSIRVRRPEVSVELEAVLARAMEKEPDRRYPTAVELASELNVCLVREEAHREISSRSGPIGYQGGPTTVLLIEDEMAMAEMVRKVLEKEDLHVLHFADGAAAMKRVEEVQPGLVLLDVNLPGLSGWEILKRLRRMPSYENTPIIMVTGEGGEENVVKGFHLGADDYIEKPFALPVLVARVRRQFQRHEVHT